MAQKNSSSVSTIIWIIIAFIFGVVIGLVVLGWWLWPVTWTGSSVEVLNEDAQQDYLRSAIDSYTLNQDSALAVTRYETLGQNGQVILVEIYASPAPQSELDVENFAAAVDAEDVLKNPAITEATPPPSGSLISQLSSRPLWMTLCLSGLLIFLILLLIFLIINRGRNKRKSSGKGKSTVTTYDSSEAALAESADQAQTGLNPQDTGTQPNYLTPETGPSSEIEEGELPDWLIEPAKADAKTGNQSPTVELSDEDIEAISASSFPFTDSVDQTSSSPVDQPVLPAVSGSGMTAIIASQANPPFSSEPEQTVPAVPVPDTQIKTAQAIEPPQPAEKVMGQILEETPEQTLQKFSGELRSIPEMDEIESEKLHKAGITAPLLLLKTGASIQGRESIAKDTGIDAFKILSWVNYLDLLRIKGLSQENALLLKEAGVNMMVELAARDPKSLHERFELLNSEGNTIQTIPSIEQIDSWIKQANQLPPAITY